MKWRVGSGRDHAGVFALVLLAGAIIADRERVDVADAGFMHQGDGRAGVEPGRSGDADRDVAHRAGFRAIDEEVEEFFPQSGGVLLWSTVAKSQ